MTFASDPAGLRAADYHAQVIRRINDGRGKYVAEQTVKQMINTCCPVKGSKVNILGLTFKEDCPDLRNTRVVDVIAELREDYGVEVSYTTPSPRRVANTA